jgi:hypothetical protein
VSKRLIAMADDELRELLGLIHGADSVELKLTVPEEQGFETQKALGIDPLDARIRQVFFFDTPELALDASGVVARARRTQGKPDDSVVKLRPVVPEDLPAAERGSENMKVEVDAMPGGFVCSASLRAELEKSPVRAAAASDKRLSKLFSKEQRAFFAEHAPEGIEIDQLHVLGPVNIAKLKYSPSELPGKMTVELWNYPDGSRILELSTKCAPGEAFQVAAEARAYLSGRGVELSGEQQTKTRAALEYFSNRL